MLTSDDLVEQDGLDAYDRALASDMDDGRPLYPSPSLVDIDVPHDEETDPREEEL